MSVAELAYVALAVSDVETVAGVLGDVLGLPRRDAQAPQGEPVPLFRVGRAALAILPCASAFIPGVDKPCVHHVAIAARDPLAAAAASGLAADGGALVPGLDQGHEAHLDPGRTGGVRVRLCNPPAMPGGEQAALRIDHIGVASEDNVRATEVFVGKLGLEIESTQTDVEVSTAMESFTSDRYGVVYHSRPPQLVGGLRVSFLTVGDCELELLAPFSPRESGVGAAAPPGRGPGNTAGDKGAIARFIARRGPGLHHLALRTPDIAATLHRLDAAGVELVDRRGRPGSRRALIAFVHPRALGGVLMHLVQRDDG